MVFSVFSTLTTVAAFVMYALAEQHTIIFDNRCGRGTPHLVQGSTIHSYVDRFTSNGPFESAIAYLQIGDKCDYDGGGCSLVEMTLKNPTCDGCGSSVDISLITPHSFNVPISYIYEGGSCAGRGAICDHDKCPTAFLVPTDTHVQVQCEENDVNFHFSYFLIFYLLFFKGKSKNHILSSEYCW
ncbi:glycopeptide [Cyathus striatus]|nr:glycopeptide [Cyathus striatus]